jgi:hypothetical protein
MRRGSHDEGMELMHHRGRFESTKFGEPTNDCSQYLGLARVPHGLSRVAAKHQLVGLPSLKGFLCLTARSDGGWKGRRHSSRDAGVNGRTIFRKRP